MAACGMTTSGVNDKIAVCGESVSKVSVYGVTYDCTWSN